MLTGQELLARVKQLGDASKSELVRSCGYVSKKKDGSERLNFTAFYQALNDAKGRENTTHAKSKETRRDSGAIDSKLEKHSEEDKKKNQLKKLREQAQRKIRQGKELSIDELNALPSFQRRALQHSALVVESRRDRERRARAESESRGLSANAMEVSQPSSASTSLTRHLRKLAGEELLNICIHLSEQGLEEHRIAVRAGYAISDMGAFRRAFARYSGTSLAPLTRMITELKEKKEPSKKIHLENSRPIIGDKGQASRNLAEKVTDQVVDIAEDTEFISFLGARDYILGQSRRIRRSSKFRSSVFTAHGCKCAACEIEIESLLEAAHIRPASEMGSDHSSNGIPLCPNHHAAFDQFMYCIEPGSNRIEYASGFNSRLLGIKNHYIRLEISLEAVEYRYLLFLRANKS